MQERGYTLIEVAVVLVIGGLLLASASALLLNYMKQTQIRTTERRLAAIDDALQRFLNLNGRYPCAAPPDAPIDSARFGFEPADCTTAAEAPGGRDGRTVRIGAVPVRTLNLPDNFIGDAWAGRFTYAVTEALARDGTYNRDEGAIFVVDSNGNQVVNDPDNGPGTAHYVIVSHGENNAGATSMQGGGTNPCPGGNLENENCNGNATFTSTLFTNTADSAGLHDDMIVFRATSAFGQQVPPGAVMAFNLNACPDGWTPFNLAGERFIVGTNGSTNYSVGDTGGAPEVTLDSAEIGFRPSTPDAIDPAAVPGTVVFAERRGPPQPHENRPPYVALLYCEKT